METTGGKAFKGFESANSCGLGEALIGFGKTTEEYIPGEGTDLVAATAEEWGKAKDLAFSAGLAEQEPPFAKHCEPV